MASRPVRVAIAEAQGLMCAEEVVTEHPLPGFDQAAIDGYAVRSVDVIGVGDGDRESGDVSLPVARDDRGGREDAESAPAKQTARVQTGRRCPPLRMRSCRCAGPTADRTVFRCCEVCGRGLRASRR